MRMRNLTLAGALVALSVMLPTMTSPVRAMSIGATALTQTKDARAQQTQDTFVEARYLRRYPRMGGYGGNWHGGHGNWNGYHGYHNHGYHNHGYHNHGYYPYWGGGVVLGFPGMYGGYGGYGERLRRRLRQFVRWWRPRQLVSTALS